MDIQKITKYLEKKGMKYRIEDKETIALEQCPFGNHESWSSAIILEESLQKKGQKEWFFFCFDTYSGMPFTQMQEISKR